MSKVQYLESRYYDNGRAEVRLTDNRPEEYTGDKYDQYIDEIGTSLTNNGYNTIRQWSKQLHIGKDELTDLHFDIETREWTNITRYI